MVNRIMVALVAVALTVAACGGGGGIDIEDAWARTSASSQSAGAVYMTISAGDVGDMLTSVSVDSSVAAMAQLHETRMSDDDSGTMMMQEVPSMAVPSGGELTLEPGSFHIMLMQLTDPLTTGSEFTVTLTFAEAGEVEVDVEVREG